jgi:hypothetical protein
MEKEPVVRLVVELPKSLHHQFKVKTVTEGTTMSSVLVNCTKAYIETPADKTTEGKAEYRTGGE